MLKILIFGGMGYLGSAITESLSASPDYDIFVTYRNKNANSRFFIKKLYEKVKTVEVDAKNFNDVKKILTDINPHIIIDLTALVDINKSVNFPMESFESSANTTLNILESIRQLNINSVYINHSSDKVYNNNEPPFVEDMSLFPSHIYDVGKYTQESIANSYYLHFGIKCINLRCANYYGPYDYNFNRLIPYLMKSFINNEKIVLRSGLGFRRDFLYIEEAADVNKMICSFIIDKDESIFGESYNFSQEQDYSVQEIIELVSKLSPNSPDLELSKTNQNIESKKLLLDCSKAKTKFNWKNLTSFEDGISLSYEFYYTYLKNNL